MIYWNLESLGLEDNRRNTSFVSGDSLFIAVLDK